MPQIHLRAKCKFEEWSLFRRYKSPIFVIARPERPWQSQTLGKKLAYIALIDIFYSNKLQRDYTRLDV